MTEMTEKPWDKSEAESNVAGDPAVEVKARTEADVPDNKTDTSVVDAEMDLETRRSKESLKCILSEAEILELGKQSARAGAVIRQKEAELQAGKSQFKAEIDKLTAERNEAEGKINAGWEFRTVEVEILKDFTSNSVRVVRLDTYETVRERTMTTEERQGSLIQ